MPPRGGLLIAWRYPRPLAVSKPALVSDGQTAFSALGNIQYFHKVLFMFWGCLKLPGPRAIPVRSTEEQAGMPGKPPRMGVFGATANRDGSRSDPELDAAVFTVLTVGQVDGLSALFRCPNRLTFSNLTGSRKQAK
jgi:hypothetical protein